MRNGFGLAAKNSIGYAKVSTQELQQLNGSHFFATIGFEDDIELLEELGCDSIKIASADVNHLPLLRKAANTGMCIQLGTGNATIGEIEEAVKIFRSEGNKNIIIHKCPFGYFGINAKIKGDLLYEK